MPTVLPSIRPVSEQCKEGLCLCSLAAMNSSICGLYAYKSVISYSYIYIHIYSIYTLFENHGSDVLPSHLHRPYHLPMAEDLFVWLAICHLQCNMINQSCLVSHSQGIPISLNHVSSRLSHIKIMFELCLTFESCLCLCIYRVFYLHIARSVSFWHLTWSR